MQNSQLRVSPRAPFWAVSGEQRACHPESYYMAPQPSLLPHFQLHPFLIPVKNKYFSYCLSHHTLSGLKTRPSAWNALSFPAWQTPTHPSKPNSGLFLWAASSQDSPASVSHWMLHWYGIQYYCVWLHYSETHFPLSFWRKGRTLY